MAADRKLDRIKRGHLKVDSGKIVTVVEKQKALPRVKKLLCGLAALRRY